MQGRGMLTASIVLGGLWIVGSILFVCALGAAAKRQPAE